MNILIPILLKELNQEAQTTRNMLQRIPNDKYDWQPHTKSMTMRQLAVHIAEIPAWIGMALTTEEIDFAAEGGYKPSPVSNTAELLALLEKSYLDGREQLAQASDEQLLNGTWTMRGGDQIYAVFTKQETIRHALSQLIHHRAQLGVYLRLLNIPIPGSYGPSADETAMEVLGQEA